MRLPVLPHSWQHLTWSGFLICFVFDFSWWCLTSFHILVVHIIWWHVCSNILSSFIGLFGCYWVLRILYIFLNTSTLQVCVICKYFLLICGKPFIFLIVLFEELIFKILIKFGLSIYDFMDWVVTLVPKNSSLI